MNSIKIYKFKKLLAIHFLIFIMISGELMGSSLPKYYTKTLENGYKL